MSPRDRYEPPPLTDFFRAMASDERGWSTTPETVAASQERLEQSLREARIIESGIKGAITDDDMRAVCSGQGLIETHALKSCKRWFNVRSGSSTRPLSALVLVGLTGRGKTVAAAWLLARIGGRYVTAETVRRAVVGTHWRDGMQLEGIVNTRCLVIDDAGGEHEANTATAAMFEVVNRRIGHPRAWTLITANLTAEEFSERYGERTKRRIEHMGAIIEVQGEDLRRTGV